MRLIIVTFIAVAATLALYLSVDLSGLSAWAVGQQRLAQNQMAGAVRALKTGDAGAYLALLAATGTYGFVHALGPGHGKYLVSGVGLGSSVSALRLVGLAVASSLGQTLWAVILVYGGFALIEATAHQMTDLAENLLAPLSYLAIGSVGLVLVWRGIRALRRTRPHSHGCGHDHAHGHHDHACCGHAHGPSAEEAARVHSLREAVLLVLSIAIRPCTGAIFLLVIAWQMDLKIAGLWAVLVMGLGTSALTGLVAISSVAARGLTLASSGPLTRAAVVMPAIQIFAGSMIALISLGMWRALS